MDARSVEGDQAMSRSEQQHLVTTIAASILPLRCPQNARPVTTVQQQPQQQKFGFSNARVLPQQWLPTKCPVSKFHTYVFSTLESLQSHLRQCHTDLTPNGRKHYVDQTRISEPHHRGKIRDSNGKLQLICLISSAHSHTFLQDRERRLSHKMNGIDIDNKNITPIS